MIVEICLIIIAGVFLLRSLVEIGILFSLFWKIRPLLQISKGIAKELQSITKGVKQEFSSFQSSTGKVLEDTKKSIELFQSILNRILRNLSILNSILETLVDWIQGFVGGSRKKTRGN